MLRSQINASYLRFTKAPYHGAPVAYEISQVVRVGSDPPEQGQVSAITVYPWEVKQNTEWLSGLVLIVFEFEDHLPVNLWTTPSTIEWIVET